MRALEVGGMNRGAIDFKISDLIDEATGTYVSLKLDAASGSNALALNRGSKIMMDSDQAGGSHFISDTVSGITINGTRLIPNVDTGNDLGASSIRWNNIYAIRLQDSGGNARLTWGGSSTTNLYFGGAGTSGTAIGHTFNTPSYTTTGDLIASFQNNGVQKLSVDKDGATTASGTVTAAGFVASGSSSINVGSSKFVVSGASGKVTFDATDGSGTPGNVTINKPSGQVAVAAGSNQVVVTNSLVTTSSVVLAVLQVSDATATGVRKVIVASGSFTIALDANATAAAKVGFVVFN
jgi:hypothetical protein